MNLKSLIPLIAGLGIGGFALKVGLDTLQSAKGSNTTETTQVWTPKIAIPRGTKITEEMIQPISFPSDLVPSGALKEKEQVVGRVPRIDTPAGLPVLDEMLLPPGHAVGIHVPNGYRAVAVKIDEGSGVDFHLEPGCHVDVVGYFTVQKGKQRDTVARTLIENVEVAAVGPRFSAVSEDNGKTGRPTRAVTLLVKPDQVPILHLAEQRGKIKLSMRNDEDSVEVGELPPTSEGELLGQLVGAEDDETAVDESRFAGLFQSILGTSSPASVTVEPEPAPVPVPVVVVAEPPADPPWVVYVYRGGKQEVVRFANRDSRQRVEEEQLKEQSSAANAAAASTGQSAKAGASESPAKESATIVAEETAQDQREGQEDEQDEDPETQESRE